MKKVQVFDKVLIKSVGATGIGKCQMRTVFCGGVDPTRVSEPMFSKDCRNSKLYFTQVDFIL